MEELIQYIMDICSREPSDYGKLINMLITDNHLREYVDKIVINHTNCLGMYIPNKKELRININRIARKAFMKSFDIQSEFNIEPDRFATICVLATVFHELYHVEQTKMCFDSSDDTLHKIVREGIELGRRSPNGLNVNERLLYHFRYLDVLTERSAEVNSMVKVLMCRKSGAVLANECRFFIYYFNY